MIMVTQSISLTSTDNVSADAGFELRKPELLDRRNAKWQQYPADVIPAFVADMDFRIAPAIQKAIQRSVEAFDYGYPMREGGKADKAVANAYVARMKAMFDWDIEVAQVLALADLVQATYACIMAFSEPGDGVIVQVPNYPPFRDAVATTGRTFIPLTMERTADSYRFDLEALEKQIDARTKIFILCNPQNPTGRVFTRSELDEVLAFAEKHDLIVVSDEIHSDLIYPGARHIPFSSISDAAAARTVTLNSATKSFNIPGLRCAVAYFGNEALMKRFHARIPPRLTGSVNSIGVDATVAAWTESQPWLDAVLAHLFAMRNHAAAVLKREIPNIGFRLPESTYLMWLDCTDLGIEGSAFDFFLEHARIGFSPGEGFHPRAEKFVRMNFATSEVILDEMLERMITAIRSNIR
jgi:cystathionine beta-lyase